MLIRGMSLPRGLVAGVVTSALLLAADQLWRMYAPGAEETRYWVFFFVINVLGFPIVYVLDAVSVAIGDVGGPETVVSVLSFSFIGLPLNWMMIGWLYGLFSKRNGSPTD